MSATQIKGSTQIQANTVTSGQVDSSIIIAAGSNAFTGNQSMGGNQINNLANGILSSDAATYGQLLAAIQGFSQKTTARVATTAALPTGTYSNGTAGVGATFTVTATGTLTVDGVVTALGDYILVKNQASAFQNGLYVVTTAGASGVAAILTRATDMDTSSEFNGALVPVDNEGTANANTIWLANNVEAGIVVGTTNITFTQLAAPSSYVEGNGIVISGTTISVADSNGLGFSSGSLVVIAASGGALTVGSGGVSVNVDGSTITINGSDNLAVPTGGIGTTQLAAASVTVAKLAAQATGTGLKGGAGSNLAIQFSNNETPSGTINGSNTTFTLANTPVSGQEQVFVNGIKQTPGSSFSYQISGVTITFNTGSIPQSGDQVLVSYFY